MKLMKLKYKNSGGKGNMKKLGLIALMALLMMGISYATITCTWEQSATTVGTANTYIRDVETDGLNITISGWTGDSSNATAAKILVSSGTISGGTVFNSTDGSNNTRINFSVNTYALSDDTTYSFSVTVYNETGETLGTCAARNFIPDNTKPVITGASPVTDTRSTSDRNNVFSTTCTNTSSSTLYLEGTAYTMTESSDACSYTVPFMTDGSYPWYTTASDGLNSTTGTTITFVMSKGGGFIPGGGSASGTGTMAIGGNGLFGGGGDNNMMLILLVVVGFMVFGKKKGNTRKKKR